MPLSELEDGVLEALESEKSVVNRFDGLPSFLLEKIVKIITEKLIEKPPCRFVISPFLSELLTTSNLRTLDLALMKRDIHSWTLESRILNTATVRSSHLETLRVNSFHCHYHEHLNFISKFSKLKVLEISYSEAGNDCFQILGTHCIELRELHAKFSKVSDDGIRELCVTGNCKSICVLDLTGCQCTTKALQMALDNLPVLKVLCHESLLEGLAEIAQNALDRKLKLPKYSLSTLHVLVKTAYKSGSLRKSLLLCPNVTKVFLSMRTEGLKDVDLLSLLSLEKLCVFVIRNFVKKREGNELFFYKDLTFDGGIVPLLQKFGSSLETLCIEGFFLEVDIMVVIENCPNLQTLCLLSDSYKMVSTTDEGRNCFRRDQPILKKLEVLCLTSENYWIAPQNLLTLFSSPLLIYIHIKRCDTLTDDILHRVAKLHSFCNLETLVFHRCSSITKRGVDVFMKETNPLRKIYIGGCEKITLENFNDWEKTAIWIKKNWHINFYVSDY
ncbi:uncharacterized protein LOC124336743 isoform X3 [Daphnia pulicaria]|nr:uncharacterized protein LOC124336743 isoform X3 [Daphnia pulicaria]